MFTKPVGEDAASPVLSTLGDGAERLEHARGTLEQSFGLKLSLKGFVIASIVAFYVLRGFLAAKPYGGDLSVTLTAVALLLGYPVILLMGKIQRHREAEAKTNVPTDNGSLGLLRPVMWLAGRWWGTVLMLIFWPALFTWLYTLASSLMPILLGAAAFWLLWTVGNRLLAHA